MTLRRVYNWSPRGKVKGTLILAGFGSFLAPHRGVERRPATKLRLDREFSDIRLFRPGSAVKALPGPLWYNFFGRALVQLSPVWIEPGTSTELVLRRKGGSADLPALVGK